MDKYVYIQSYLSPCGELLLGSYRDRLCFVEWVENREDISRYVKYLKTEIKVGNTEVITFAKKGFNEYFRGERKQFEIPISLFGTEFQKRVWEELLNIPYGTVLSYSEVAERVGNSRGVRAVANAIKSNPLNLIVPCHRVIGKNGELTGYKGGLERKEFLLRLEKVII